MGARRALIFASGSRYVIMVLNLVASLFVAHHVSPDQFGLTVLGNGALLLAGALREVGAAAYLVQHKTLEDYHVRSAFTVSFVVTLAAAAVLVLGAHPIAAFYHDPRLAKYLRLMACAFMLGPFVTPIVALLTREMAFQRIAAIDVGAGLVNAIVTVILIRMGFGFYSVAWASIASGFAALLLGFRFKPGLAKLRPSFRAWREVVRFGFHGSATAMVYTVGETLVFLMLGKLVSIHAVGLLQRSYLLTQIPERVLLAGAGAVALPAFAQIAREDGPLVPTYLHSIRLVVPVYLATMLAIVVLARPLVMALLGPQWHEAVALMRILAAGHLVGVGAVLNLTILVAVGGVRWTTPLALFQFAVLIASVAIAAPFGLEAVAGTSFVTMPIFSLVSYLAVRRYVRFAWGDVRRAIAPGVVAGVCSVVPATAIVASGWMADWPVVVLAVATVLGGLSWLGALRLLRHPLYLEIARAIPRLRAGAGVRPSSTVP